MFRRKLRLLALGGILATLGAVSMVIPASATHNTGQFISEGCTGWGDNYVSGSNLHIRTTAWLTTNGNSPCSYVFVQGWYYNSNAVFTPAGPGWSAPNGGFAYDYPGPSGFTEIGVNPAGHSMCWAGGTCPAQVFRNSYYP